MQAGRLKILLETLEAEPHDPFNRYAVAMEHLGKKPDESLKHLDVLLENHPEYLATYYQAAVLYAERDSEEKASALFEKGISLAQKQQNEKAVRELSAAYSMYKDEWNA